MDGSVRSSGAPVRLELGGAALAQRHTDALCVVYDEVFSAPPFLWRPDESLLHRQRLADLVEEPTFAVALAVSVDQLVGFAYGFALAADTKRWSRLTQPVAAEVTAEWPGRTFMLFDFAVRAAHRGQGIGRMLHDRLLARRTEERATLTVQPTASDTKRIYEHWGWRQVGQTEGGPTAAAPLFDVYLRDRLDDLRAAQAATR